MANMNQVNSNIYNIPQTGNKLNIVSKGASYQSESPQNTTWGVSSNNQHNSWRQSCGNVLDLMA